MEPEVPGRRRKRRRVISSSDDEGEADGTSAGVQPPNADVEAEAPLPNPAVPAEVQPEVVKQRVDVPEVQPEVVKQRKDAPEVQSEVVKQSEDAPEVQPEVVKQREDFPEVQPEVVKQSEDAPEVQPEVVEQREDVPEVQPEAVWQGEEVLQGEDIHQVRSEAVQQGEGIHEVDPADAGRTTGRKAQRHGPKKSHDVVKALRAAKRFLTTSTRAEDPVMCARSEVLAELSLEEATAFAEANSARKKGEWSFEVLSARVEAKLREQGGAGGAGGPPRSLNAGAGSGISDAAAGPEQELPKEPSAAPAPPGLPGALASGPGAGGEPMAAPAAPSPEELPAKVPAPRAPKARGRGSRSRPKAAPIVEQKNLTFSAEVVQGPPPPAGRRRFAPIRPAARPLGSLAPKAPAAVPKDAGGADEPKPARARCNHATEVRAGPYVICGDCGEELRFDAWRLEYVDDLEV